MPTYRNDGTKPEYVTDTTGSTVRVAPGGSVQTYEI